MRPAAVVTGLLCLAAAASHAQTRSAPRALAFALPLLGSSEGQTDAASLDALDEAVRQRRERLTWHQASGFATEALHVGALVFSVLDDRERFGGGAQTGRWRVTELSLVSAVVAGSGLTFTLAALAPKPFQRVEGVDTTLVHRALMMSGAGLSVAKLVLSALLFGALGPDGNETLVTLHRVATYAAPAFFLAGSAVQVL